MVLKRALAATASLSIAAIAGVTFALPASAVSGPDDYAADALEAAAAADEDFVNADWDEVSAEAERFDYFYGKLLDALAQAQHDADAAEDAAIEAATALVAAQTAVAEKDALATAAQSDRDTAQAAFDETIASVLGAPAWWTQINTRPVKVSDLESATASADAALTAADENVAIKQAAFDSATGLARVLAGVALGIAKATQAAAELRVEVLAQAWTAVDGDARKQALADAEEALAEAQAQAASAEQARADAQETAEATANAVTDAQAWLDHLLDLVASLADAAASVADRRADLVDLDTVRQTVVWTLGADNVTPHAGDIVKLTFTVPNSALFDLSDAQVKVVSPSGITLDCDIVGGVVAAGALVTCHAVYVPTDADATAGQVVFEVELTGYIPLGPGNPRGHAATRTLITATQTITVQVAPRVVTETEDPESDSLAATGASATQLMATAIAMMGIGTTLLVARRRLPF